MRSPSVDVTDAGPGPTDTVGTLERPAIVVVALILLTFLFLTTSSPWLGARFGESHDGRNAATWATASRALREDGPITSRFGGRTETGAYASHPPGIVAETALVELVAGEQRIVTRSPAWSGSIAAMVLTALLLSGLGLSALSVAAALAVTFSSSMFLVYGSMLDTPVTSLPFALAVLLTGQRVVAGRPPRLAVLALVALVAALSGWLALGFALVQVARLAWRARRGATRWQPAVAIATGAGTGLAVTIGWSWWVYGSFATMTAKADDKTSAVSLGTSLARQGKDLQDLYPYAAAIGALGALVAVLGLADRRWRGLFASAALPVAAYGVVFRGGAHMHDYWNYAALIPIAIGTAGGVEVVLRCLPTDRRPHFMAGIAATAALLAVASSWHLSDAEARLRNSLGTPALVDRAAEVAPDSGPVVAYRSPAAIESPWVRYETRRPGLALHDKSALDALARSEPEFPVLMVWVTLPNDAVDQVLTSAYAVDGPYAVVPAGTVVSSRPAN